MKRLPFWSWLWLLLGILYFFLPLFATFEFSLRARRGEYSFDAYQNVLNDPQFSATFTYSVTMALATILVGVLLIVPTVFWVHLRLPRIKPLIEFITLMPFVVPAVVLVFGLLRIYSRPPLALTNNDRTTDLLLVCGYTVLSQVGITTKRDGTLGFDTAKFTSAVTADPGAVATLFGGAGAVGGVADRVHDFLTVLTRSGGLIDIDAKSITDQITNIDDQLTAGQRHLDDFEANLRATYTNLELLVNNLQAQGSYLTALTNLGGRNG